MKRLKKIPTFNDDDAEREFWANADSTEYVDWSKARRVVLTNFRLTLRTKDKKEHVGKAEGVR
jgi:hypothetical protein